MKTLFGDLSVGEEFKISTYDKTWWKKISPLRAERGSIIKEVCPKSMVIRWTQMDGEFE